MMLQPSPAWCKVKDVNTAAATGLAKEEDIPILELSALPYDPVTPIEVLERNVESAFKAYMASLRASSQS